jgi:hypothetical protein
MRFWHVTRTANVPGICKRGLYARFYGRHPVLMGNPRNLEEHLSLYRRNCKAVPCSVVVFDVPDDKVRAYVVDSTSRSDIPRKYGYYPIRRPLPVEFITGIRTLYEPRLASCPTKHRLHWFTHLKSEAWPRRSDWPGLRAVWHKRGEQPAKSIGWKA